MRGHQVIGVLELSRTMDKISDENKRLKLLQISDSN